MLLNVLLISQTYNIIYYILWSDLTELIYSILKLWV